LGRFFSVSQRFPPPCRCASLLLAALSPRVAALFSCIAAPFPRVPALPFFSRRFPPINLKMRCARARNILKQHTNSNNNNNNNEQQEQTHQTTMFRCEERKLFIANEEWGAGKEEKRSVERR
jgi:hypothetical protein